MADIINDLFDISRLESYRGLEFQMEPIDVSALIREAVQSFSDTSPEHRFEIEAPGRMPSIRGDAFRLSQVITNLVSYAVEYSPKRGTITIHSRATACS